jgi:hypothetical protein
MEEEIEAGFASRLDGPFSLRFLLQPTMAILFAFKDGLKDAREDADPYLWSLAFKPGQRRERIQSAWASAGTVTIVAFLLDCAFQWVAADQIKFLGAATMAVLLCVLPYSLLRGPISRIAMRRKN